MFSFMCGTIVDAYDGIVILKCNDIGYELNVSANTMRQCNVGDNTQLYCYLQVKEDGIALYGFATAEEKAMFLRLISVSGVGCKVAQAILSGITPNDLALALYNGDTKVLTKIKGLGKKTAERLILELKEKVTINVTDVATLFNTNQCDCQEQQLTADMNNAVTILMSLGLARQDAVERIKSASEQGAVTTEQLINCAFRS